MTHVEFMIELSKLLVKFCDEMECDRCPAYLTCASPKRYEMSEECHALELVNNILRDERSETYENRT